MPVTAGNNSSQTMETALKNAINAALTTASITGVFMNGFQVKSAHDKVLPQIQFGCGVFVPNGHNSPTGTMSCMILIATDNTDDPICDNLGKILGAVLSAISTANSAPSSFKSSYLPSTYDFGGIVIDDGPPPLVEENINVMAFNCTIEMCVN